MSDSCNSREESKILLNDILVFLFACWPFFWNLWSVLQLPAEIFGYRIPVYVLLGIIALSMLGNKISINTRMWGWLIFIGVTFIGAGNAWISEYGYDIIVCICGVAFCLLKGERRYNPQIILKSLSVIGMFVSITVIVNSISGLFSNTLLWIYTADAKKIIRTAEQAGGILPHTASAGGFVVSGAAAYALLDKEKKNRVDYWLVLSVYVLALIILKKRAMIVWTAASMTGIHILKYHFNRKILIKIKALIKKIFIAIALVFSAFFVLSKVPFVREQFELLIERFITNDSTQTGRTILYALAFRLIQQSPWLGIGWARYRGFTYGIFGSGIDRTYEVHNVYLQLLCETGIIGLAAFLFAVVSVLIYTCKKYRHICENVSEGGQQDLWYFSLFLQMFFVLYCLSGNPLYDYNFLITYFIGVFLSCRNTEN